MRERVCNNCGGKSYKVVGQNMVKCMFCGTLYVDEHASKEEEVLLVHAYELLRERKFAEAIAEFDKILALYPRSFESFYGKTLAKHKIILYTNKKGTKKRPRFFGEVEPIEGDIDFSRALEVAPPEVAAQYKETSKVIDKVVEKYEKKSVSFDVFLHIIDNDDEESKDIVENLVEKFKLEEFSTYVMTDHKKEDEVFRALKTSKAYVLITDPNSSYTNGDVKHIFDRYFYFVSQKEKSKNSVIVALDRIELSDLPQDFKNCKNVFDLNSPTVIPELILKTKDVIAKSAKEIAKIEKVKIEKGAPKKKEYIDLESVQPVDLGHYHIDNVELSDTNKIKWIFLTLKHGDFDSAREMILTELEKDPNNAELLFAKLLVDKNISTEDEFFADIAHFENTEEIETILRFSDKEFAEVFVNKWEDLIVKLDKLEYYNLYLLTLAKFNTANREKLISAAQTKASETMDEELISKVEKCFDKNDVQRFVDFYYELGQKSDNQDYYKRILEIDEGHEQSNLIRLFENFKTDEDLLTYRNSEELQYVFKFLSDEKRDGFVATLAKMILPVAFKDLEQAEKQLDFYLGYVSDDNKLAEILKDISVEFRTMRFFRVAEKYLSIAVTKKSDADLFWELIKCKAHCNSDQEMVMSKIKITQIPEWQNMVNLADEDQTERFAEVASKINLYKGEVKPFVSEILDKKHLKEKLQEFLNRNEKILLEFEKLDENYSSTNYYKLQFKPFENYISQLDKTTTYQEYKTLYSKIEQRLDLLDLNLDMSVSAIQISSRKDGLKKVIPHKKEVEKQREKKLRSLKHTAFLKSFFVIFLEFCPMLFTMLLLAILIGAPKEVYLYFSQAYLIFSLLFCVGIGLGNLVYVLYKKKKLRFKQRISYIALTAFAGLNLLLFCFGFYITPATISVSNAKEFVTLMNNASNGYYQLVQDIDMSNYNWKGVYFTGRLNGNNHQLTNLKLTNGGFLKANSGIVENLKLHIANSKLSTGSDFGLLANQNSGTIKNCSIAGTVELTVATDTNVGGVVGTSIGGVVAECTTNVNFVINVASKNVNVGGVAGKLTDGAKNAGIKGSKVIVDIQLSGNCSTLSNVGGLVGQFDHAKNLNIERNETHIDIDVSGEHGELNIGGLVGLGYASSENNYSTGSIVATGTATKGYVGGLYGKYQNASNLTETINHSYSTVEISTAYTKGGLVGALGGRVEKCFATQEISSYGEKLFTQASIDCSKSFSILLGFNPLVWDLSGNMPTLIK